MDGFCFRNKDRKKVLGIGLLELMLSLSIIAILLVMATRYYLVTSYSNKLNRLTEEISQIQGAVYTWKGTKSDYTDLTAGKLIDMGLIAGGDIDPNDNTKIITPWSVPITISPKGGEATKALITIDMTSGEEKKACTALERSFDKINGPDFIAKCEGGNKFTFEFP